ncbi:calmodulin-binding protein 60 A-like isoform X1 [Salvia divinorum]|uniref:Calmodulin-binding protein 60 A-like isoform X1 n=1 Tax=Salvia divinorum TaxID=28513 RepID=A0ABD1GBP8_SALDI
MERDPNGGSSEQPTCSDVRRVPTLGSIVKEEVGHMRLQTYIRADRLGLSVSDDLILREVIKAFQPASERLLSEGTRNEFPEERSLQLKFLDNKVADAVTGKELKGLKGECLKLALLDSNEHTVTCGPGSSEKLGHGKYWIKLCTCRLGARIGQNLAGTMVQETWTAPFKVKDKRRELYNKLPYPSLTSKVWRLKGIDKTGKRHDRLKKKYIETVQDFLFWFHVNPEELQNKILCVSDGIWKTIVSHAKRCQIDCEKMFYHKSSSEPQRCVIYDCVGKLKGEMESQFVGINNMCADRKDDALKLLTSVLERASALYDDEKKFPYTITSTIGHHEPLGSKERGEASNPDPQSTPPQVMSWRVVSIVQERQH